MCFLLPQLRLFYVVHKVKQGAVGELDEETGWIGREIGY